MMEVTVIVPDSTATDVPRLLRSSSVRERQSSAIGCNCEEANSFWKWQPHSRALNV